MLQMRESLSRFGGHEQGGSVAALLALIAGWAALAWPWLCGRVTIPWDAKAQFLPQLQFMAESFARGESPFWSPNVFSGHPQIADPQSLIFAPPYLLLAAFDASPTAWAADVTLYGLVLAGAAAMLQWLIDKGWHPAAALLSALSFAFGAAMAWRIQHVGQVMSLAYLPMTLLCLDRALQRSSVGYGVAAGLAAGCLVLGRDQVALLSVYFLIAYVAASWWQAADRAVMLQRAIAPLAAAALTGLLVIAVPVLLTSLIAAQSNRPSIDFEGAGRGSLHPALLLTALAPDVFGASGHMGAYWGPPSFVWNDTGLYIAQNMGQLYLGALPALLLAGGAVTGVLWRREAKVFAIALGVAVFYALGWYTPVFKLMHAVIPGVDLYRRPADAVFLIGFLASVLAGFALNAWLSPDAPSLSRRQLTSLGGLLAASFAAMIACAIHFGQLASAWPAIVLPAGLLIASMGLLVALRRRLDARPLVVLSAIAAFLASDLAVSNRPNGSTALPPEHYAVLDPDTTNETIALLKARTAAGRSDTRRDRVELVGFGFHWPNASLTHDLENTLGYNPLRLGMYTRATGAGDHSGLPDQKGFSPLFPSYRSPLANLLGLRFIATSVPIEQIDKSLKPGELPLVAKTDDGFVYENTAALPRVLFATSARSADFDQLIATGVWPEADLKTTVLLDTSAADGPRRPGQARLTGYHNTQIRIEADSPDGGWVVLNDIWQPWWFAHIDGAEVPLLRANALFRAVAVPPGRHTVTMTFQPLRGALKQLRARGRP